MRVCTNFGLAKSVLFVSFSLRVYILVFFFHADCVVIMFFLGGGNKSRITKKIVLHSLCFLLN